VVLDFPAKLAQLNAVIDNGSRRRTRVPCPGCSRFDLQGEASAGSADGKHPYQVSEENYDLFTSLFRSSGTGRGLLYRAPNALTGRPGRALANFRAGPAHLPDLVTYLRKIERITARSRKRAGAH
jgi:hypothetical protein